MKLRTITTIFLAISSLLFITTPQADSSAFFTPFSKDLRQEKIFANRQNKKGILLFFGTPYCPFCKRMKEAVLSKPDIQLYFQTNFRLLEINILDEAPISNFSGNPTTAKQFAINNHIRVTPTLVFYDLEGERLFKQVGIIADPQEFRWLGEYILEEGYNRESFGHYKRKKRARSK